MKPFTRVLSAFAVGILLQGGVYLYLDQYMFAPTTEFNVSGASKDDTKNFPDVKEGRKYVSYDHQFMAVVTDESLRIYKAGESKPTTVSLKGRSISYFDWMPDRNYAIMGLYTDNKVVMARLNADDPEHEVDTELEDVPKGSRIVDAAYYSGKLGVGFKPIYKYNNPTTLSEVTMNAVKEIIANGSDDTTKVTEDNDKSSKDSSSKKKN